MGKRKKKNREIGVGYYVVAYIDLLGQKDVLRNLKDLPDESNPDSWDSFLNTLRDVYSPIKHMRTSFRQFFDSFSQRSGDIGELNKQQRDAFKAATSYPIRIQPFSDAVVISVPLRIAEYRVPTRGILGVLSAAAMTCIFCLAAGHPLRGGIDVGIAMDMSSNEIYGAALARAYTLESKVAQYPRIVVGQELIQYLRISAKEESNDAHAKFRREIAKHCLDLVAIDVDEYPILDYLGEGFRDDFARATDIGKGKDIIAKAYRHVVQCFSKFRGEQNTKLSDRYERVMHYFESRLGLWFKSENEIADLKRLPDHNDTNSTASV